MKKIILLALVLLSQSAFADEANKRKPSSSKPMAVFRLEPARFVELTEFQTVQDMVPATKKGPYLVLVSGATKCAVNADAAKTAGLTIGELANLILVGGAEINCLEKDRDGEVAKSIILSYGQYK